MEVERLPRIRSQRDGLVAVAQRVLELVGRQVLLAELHRLQVGHLCAEGLDDPARRLLGLGAAIAWHVELGNRELLARLGLDERRLDVDAPSRGIGVTDHHQIGLELAGQLPPLNRTQDLVL